MSDGQLLPNELFNGLPADHLGKIRALPSLYKEWNRKINLISRKDEDNIMLHHILHSLSILKTHTIESGTHIADIGTGGGFPGIPLAITRPDCTFTLIDATAKKLDAVRQIANEIHLKNVTILHGRAENFQLCCDLVVCRAVSSLANLWKWKEDYKQTSGTPPPLVALKGGHLQGEIAELMEIDKCVLCKQQSLYPILKYPYYKKKYAVTVTPQPES